MSMSFAIREIRGLDPRCDHQRIVYLSYYYDFPIDAAITSAIVLLRGFGAPRISTIVDASGEWHRNGQVRSAVLVQAILALVGHGYNSHVGQGVISQINAAHRSYQSAGEEFVYLLSRFVFEPIAWNAQCGWRPYCEQEKESLFHFWTAVGKRMHVRDMPQTSEALHSFMTHYEQAHCRPHAANHRLYLSFREVLAGWVPGPARPLVRWALPHMLDQELRDQLMIPATTTAGRTVARAVLLARRRLVSLLPKRTEPYPFRNSPPFLCGSGPLTQEAADRSKEGRDTGTPTRSARVWTKRTRGVATDAAQVS